MNPSPRGRFLINAASLLCFVCFISLSADGPSREAVTVQFIRHGKLVTERPRAEFSTNVMSLLTSCSVHSTSYAVQSNTWSNLLASDSYIHLSFPRPRTLQVMVTDGVGPRAR